MAVHPPVAFKLLNTLASRILCKYIGGRTALIVIRTDVNPMAGRRFQFDIGSHLRIVRQISQNPISLPLRSCIRLQAVVLPLRDGPNRQTIPSSLFQRNQPRPAPTAVIIISLLERDILSRIKTDVRLRQTIVGFFSLGQVIRRMPTHLPSTVRIQRLAVHRQAESQSRCQRIAMAETVLTEIPHQYGHQIVPFTQTMRPLKYITICILRIRAAFQSAFPHLQFSVHPKPILAVCRNTQFHLRRFVIQGHIHAIA